MQVSVNGVTGPRPNVNPRVKDLLKEIKQVRRKDYKNSLAKSQSTLSLSRLRLGYASVDVISVGSYIEIHAKLCF